LKLLKNNTTAYEPFHKSVERINGETMSKISGIAPALMGGDSKHSNLLEKYYHFLQSIMSFDKKTETADKASEIVDNLKVFIRRAIPVKESGLFLIDETSSDLVSVDPQVSDNFFYLVNNLYKEGILDWILDSGKPNVVPEINNYTFEGSKLNYIFFPVYEKKKKKGILAILTPLTKEDINEFENQVIQLALDLSLAKINKIQMREELNSVYREMQTYQAKLANDFKLSAIGELTEGIIEDINNPLQVIMSYVDIMADNEEDKETGQIIKEQIKKIKFVLNRLVKFANINEEAAKVQPCDLNLLIKDFNDLIKSSLDQVGIETVLDLEKDIPSILSHSNYIFQLLINAMGIIKSRAANGGGVIIQTRYISENVALRIISTIHIESAQEAKKNGVERAADLNFKIIDNLVKKHEGEFNLESSEQSGSVLVFKFPLRRKIRV
jgi:K+-sensing histidine kinase KdpD